MSFNVFQISTNSSVSTRARARLAATSAAAGLVAVSLATAPASAARTAQGLPDSIPNAAAQSTSAWHTASAQPTVGWHSAELQRVLHKLNKAGAVGIVAAAKSNSGSWAGAAGHRELRGAKVQAGDKARVGSITKPVVAATILSLVEQGRISLSTTVDDVLPGLLGTRGKQITLEHLLSHRSGLSDYILPLLNKSSAADMAEFSTEAFTDKQLVATALTQPWLFPPGTATSYSNTGYIVAGLMAEKVSGRSMQSLVTETLHRAGMHDSHYPTQQEFSKPHLTEYARTGTQWQRLNQHAGIFGAAGALISTPEDLNRFWRSLFTGRLLKSSTVNNMITPRGKLSTVGYGLGVMQVSATCHGKQKPIYGHNGATFGTHSISASTRDGRAQSSGALTGRLFTADAATKQVMPELIVFPAMEFACSDKG